MIPTTEAKSVSVKTVLIVVVGVAVLGLVFGAVGSVVADELSDDGYGFDDDTEDEIPPEAYDYDDDDQSALILASEAPSSETSDDVEEQFETFEWFVDHSISTRGGGFDGEEYRFHIAGEPGVIHDADYRLYTKEEAVMLAEEADGYRETLDEHGFVPVEDAWASVSDHDGVLISYQGFQQNTLQRTSHPDKSVTATLDTGEEWDVGNGFVRWNETTNEWELDNPGSAYLVEENDTENDTEIELHDFDEHQENITDLDYQGFLQDNVASTEVPGQSVYADFSDFFDSWGVAGYRPVRNAYVGFEANVSWMDYYPPWDPLGDGTGFYIDEDYGDPEVWGGDSTSIAAYNTELVADEFGDPEDDDVSGVPHVWEEEAVDTHNGAAVEYETTGDEVDVVQDHWVTLSHLNPGAKFKGTINGGEVEEFYVADPDGFEAIVSHDYRIEHPSSITGAPCEEWDVDSVDVRREAVFGEGGDSGGPALELEGDEESDTLVVSSTIEIDYTHRWGEESCDENEESVTAVSIAEEEYEIRFDDTSQPDVTVYLVDRGGEPEIWYSGGDRTITENPLGAITVDGPTHELTHTAYSEWYFSPVSDFGRVEYRDGNGGTVHDVTWDPEDDSAPKTSTTDLVMGGEPNIPSSLITRWGSEGERTEYHVQGPNSTNNFTTSEIFGGRLTMSQGVGLSEIDEDDVTAETIFGQEISDVDVVEVEYERPRIETAVNFDGEDDVEDRMIHARLVDQHGNPIPDRELRVDGGKPETVTTDEDGRVAVEPDGFRVSFTFEGDSVELGDDVLYDQASATHYDTYRIYTGIAAYMGFFIALLADPIVAAFVTIGFFLMLWHFFFRI